MMSLITCHECKQQISSEAKACPQCGAKPQKKGGLGAGGVVALTVVGYMAYALTTGGEPVAKRTPAEAQGDKELNIAIAAARMLKGRSKDPSSFAVESFLIFPGGDTCYEYRGKNSFGAVVPGKAVFNPPGTMLSSEMDGRKFIIAWNATCTRHGGEERAGGLNLLKVF